MCKEVAGGGQNSHCDQLLVFPCLGPNDFPKATVSPWLMERQILSDSTSWVLSITLCGLDPWLHADLPCAQPWRFLLKSPPHPDATVISTSFLCNLCGHTSLSFRNNSTSTSLGCPRPPLPLQPPTPLPSPPPLPPTPPQPPPLPDSMNNIMGYLECPLKNSLLLLQKKYLCIVENKKYR